MPRLTTHRSKSAISVAFVLLLASLVLAACGSSSKSPSTTTSTTASASTSTSTSTTGKPSGPAAGRFAALRECLQKNGITLPKRTPGAKRGPGGGFLGGGSQLPKGVTRAQYEAAIRKCGGAAFRGPRTGANPVLRAALTKFAACMRENGVNLPEPSKSGTGPIFDTKGVNTKTPQFKAAETKCSADLRGAFRRPPGSGTAAPGSAGAPAAG